MTSRQAILDGVVEAIAHVTLRDATEVDPDAQLFTDLGLESIDVLDLLFELEERFTITVGPPPPFLYAAFFDAEAGHFDGGRLTPAGRAALASCRGLSEASLASPDAAAYLGSVAPLVDLVHHLRAASP